MVSREKLNLEKEKFLKNLKISDIQGYIDKLLEKYYNSYLQCDSEILVEYIKEIMDVINILEPQYPHIKNYINYRLVILLNKILSNNLNQTLPLYYPPEVKINEKTEDLSSLFDEKLMKKIIMQEEQAEIEKLIEFMKTLKKDEPDAHIPSKFYVEVKSFIIDVKNGEYDFCLSESKN